MKLATEPIKWYFVEYDGEQVNHVAIMLDIWWAK